jgi:tetratricopeptide (TPR) repeat protein
MAVSPAGCDWPIVELLVADDPSAVDELERARLAETSVRGVRFVHDIVRRAVDADLTGAERRRCHIELLGHLSATGSDPSVVAHHAAEVGDIALLITESVDAAQLAADAGDHADALHHVERVLPYADHLDGLDRGHLFEVAALEYQLNNRLDDALGMAHARLELPHVRADPTTLSAAYRGLSRVEWAMARAADSRAHLERAVQVLDADLSPGELTKRYVDVATDLAMNSRWNEAAAWIRRAVERADESDDPRAFAQALGASEMIWSVVGELDQARRNGDRAIAIFRREGYARDLAITLGNRIANALNTLRIDECAAAIDLALFGTSRRRFDLDDRLARRPPWPLRPGDRRLGGGRARCLSGARGEPLRPPPHRPTARGRRPASSMRPPHRRPRRGARARRDVVRHPTRRWRRRGVGRDRLARGRERHRTAR